MLDDIESINKIDKSGILDDFERFPEQINESKEIVEKTDLGRLYKIDNIVVTGVGVSAIAGDLLQSFLRGKLKIPVFVNRQYDLPKWTNKNTLIFSVSYSGDTEETLNAFQHAYQKKCKIIGISAGGRLKEFCEKRNLPHINIPSGLRPRTALGYLLFSMIFSLQKVGLLRLKIKSDIKEAIEKSKWVREDNNKNIPIEKNLAKKTAKMIDNTIPQIYGWGVYTPVARRWANQFNENSKLISRYDEIPECNHNDIVAWSLNPEFSKNFSCILIRDEKNESVYMSERLKFMKKLFKDNTSNVIEIEVKGKKKLARMIYAMYLGDFVSCYLGLLRKKDPSSINIIEELKERLSKL
ncbi:MAG: bifunctional phosphoglucose/phosphomannose isomerase [Candidatus Thermoplasmatota archaeon]